jgi:hypothetical protein
MVFNATFSNISVISLMSVLMVEETGVLGHMGQPFLENFDLLYLTSISAYSKMVLI